MGSRKTEGNTALLLWVLQGREGVKNTTGNATGDNDGHLNGDASATLFCL